jgi:hypothetical protein
MARMAPWKLIPNTWTKKSIVLPASARSRTAQEAPFSRLLPLRAGLPRVKLSDPVSRSLAGRRQPVEFA